MDEYFQLGPTERISGRPFTDPEKSACLEITCAIPPGESTHEDRSENDVGNILCRDDRIGIPNRNKRDDTCNHFVIEEVAEERDEYQSVEFHTL